MKMIIRDLERYRLENRISQEKLAAMLSVTFCTVNRWFRGRNEPNMIQEYQIKKFLYGKRRIEDGKKGRKTYGS